MIDHALLAIAIVALAAGGLRGAAALGAEGLQRVLAALPVAATAAALSVLALGLVDLGSDPIALTLVAGAIWLAAARLLSEPEHSTTDQIADDWAGLPTPWRIALAACAGIVIALATWVVRNPALAGDGLVYHAPVVAAWVTGGDPPSLHAVAQDAPLEAYPLTTELLATWAAGIGRSFIPLSLLNPAMLTMLVLAGWSGLRSLGASRAVAALAVAAVATSPLLVSQLNTFTTDLSALAWLACCAALCAGVTRAPGLLVAAVLAAGLAIGTKTTAAPLAAICILAACLAARGRLRPLAGPLAVATLAAALVGGLWYARNLVLHGSPLWPFASAPWGDQIPALFDLSDKRLLLDPSSAEGRLDDYARALYGGLALLGGGLLAAALVPTRRVLAASATTAFALLVWVLAPFTAFPPDTFFDGLQAGAVRYLIPGIAAGAVALALAGSGPGRDGARRTAVALLAVAAAANLVGDARLGFVGDYKPASALAVDPVLPSLAVPLLGAIAGIAVLGAAAWLRARWPGRGESQRPAWVTPVAVVACAALTGALLAIPASGYVTRSTGLPPTPTGAAWLVRQPGYADDDTPVAIESRMFGTLAGDRLSHQLSLIRPGADCADVRDAAREGWVVISVGGGPSSTPVSPEAQGFADYTRAVTAGELATARCLTGVEPAYSDAELQVYAPGR